MRLVVLIKRVRIPLIRMEKAHAVWEESSTMRAVPMMDWTDQARLQQRGELKLSLTDRAETHWIRGGGPLAIDSWLAAHRDFEF